MRLTANSNERSSYSPNQWARAAFWLVVKLTLLRLAIAAAGLAALLTIIHAANTDAPWLRQVLGTFKP